jgi:predicted RNase H-like nuclease (RuvC/YqgF family)
MEQLYANIHQLEHKLTQLRDAYNQQKAMIEKLKQENERLKRLSQQKKDSTFADDPSVVQGILQASNVRGAHMRQLLDQYMQQIDQCIAFLEQTK